MDEFESFTRNEIARLRAEADALEKTLKAFQAAKNRLAGGSRRTGPDQPRTGAFGVILEAIAKAGANGMSLDQMIFAAEAQGYDVKRPTLRAQVWKAKEDGVLTQIEPGRYRSSVHDDFAGVVFNGSPEADEAVDTGNYRPGGPDAEVINSPAGGGSIPPSVSIARAAFSALDALDDDGEAEPEEDDNDEIPF